MVKIKDMESECDIETVFTMNSDSRDDIFGLLFFYWKINPTKYEQYKVRYSLTDKFYNLMFMLKVGNDDNFPEAYALYLKEINDQRHKDDHQTSGRAEVLLSLALKHGRKKAMESIVEFQIIDVSKLRIHTDKNKNFLMKLLLEHGYNLHEKVNSEVYKESLDARKRIKDYYEIKNVDEFFELLGKSVRLLYGRESSEDENLFEFILKTDNKDHAEFIRQIWIEFELWINVAILIERNKQGKLPIDYVLESGSILNFICFLVYDYNTPKSVGSTIEKNYFLKLKNQQYFNKVGQHLLFELYLVIKYDEFNNQGTCLQIIEELLKEELYCITDIEIIIGNDQITKSLYDDIGAEILNLIAFYWDFNQNPVEFGKHKEYLAARSPFCKIILALKQGTEDTFIELFDQYLEEMKEKFKSCPNLHELMLQKDRKYLLNYKMFSVKYRTFENNYHIILEIEKDPELDLYDDFIFTLFSPKQQKLKDQLSTEHHQFSEIIEKNGCKEIFAVLFARSQENNENNLKL
ncbi:unnamed protein product [Diamesa hyperborea]